jgi:hypothetical protein
MATERVPFQGTRDCLDTVVATESLLSRDKGLCGHSSVNRKSPLSRDMRLCGHSSGNRKSPLSRDKGLCGHSSGNRESLLVGDRRCTEWTQVVVRLENFVTGRANRLGDRDFR